ncbi:MAG: terminase, partial [Dehalococcoidia bacterium]|nr:terminase [Dehalococcoidia bacterium]
RRMKGWGKDPLAAVLSVCEWLGPCRFGGWDSSGHPITVPEPASWIQVAASSATQAEQNTMSLIPAIVPQRLMDEHNARLGIQVCWASGSRRIEAVSNSSRSLEGARPSFCVAGESQHWVRGNGGLALNEVIQRNLAKSPGGSGRSLAITNAHGQGEDSVAERDWEAREGQDILYSSVEAPATIDLEDDDQVKAGIMAARGDSHWIDVDRILGEFRDPAADRALCKRFFLNWIVAGSGQWMSESVWTGPSQPPQVPTAGRRITLGFDGSRTQDATALVGTDLETGLQWALGIWERDYNVEDWVAPVDEINDMVAEAFDRWRVMRLYADPYWWEESVSNWAGRHKRPDGKDAVVAWHTGSGNRLKMARAVRAYMDAVEDQALTYAEDKRFTRHVLNCRVRPLPGQAGEDGLALIQKESRGSTAVIDCAMAAVLSWQALLDSRADGDQDLPERVPLRVMLPSWMLD